MSTGKFIRYGDKEWAAGMPEGSLRMAKNWIEDRMGWLDEAGMPQPLADEDFDKKLRRSRRITRMQARRGSCCKITSSRKQSSIR